MSQEEAGNLLKFCVNEKKLNVVGLMCIPPFDQDSSPFFKNLKELSSTLGLELTSMGMSSDYMNAAKLGSTHVRIGSQIFGSRASL